MNRNDQRLENVEAKSTNLFNKLINYVMNKKIENVEELEASSTHTTKFGSIGTALMLVFMVIAFSAFTQITKKGNIEQTCFEFLETMNDPGTIEATNPDNYSVKTLNCPGDPVTLCGVCFNETEIPLFNNKPDFRPGSVLKAIVDANWNDIGKHNTPIYGPSGETVILHFREKI